MRYLVFLFILPLMLFVGCDGDGGGEHGGGADGGAVVEDGDGAAGDGTGGYEVSIIAEGTGTYPSRSDLYTLATFVTPTAGFVNGMISWSGAPDELWISFRVEGIGGPPQGRVHGSSPQASEISVEAGKEVKFYLWNPSDDEATVQYQLVFIPE